MHQGTSVMFFPMPVRLEGVDLSAKMLEVAKEKVPTDPVMHPRSGDSAGLDERGIRSRMKGHDPNPKS